MLLQAVASQRIIRSGSGGDQPYLGVVLQHELDLHGQSCGGRAMGECDRWTFTEVEGISEPSPVQIVGRNSVHVFGVVVPVVKEGLEVVGVSSKTLPLKNPAISALYIRS
ncbi:hypothetical protein SAMN04487912_105305 [Arthrobacter sp. cf158]|nr:hypothetical protein SAMN04487912_105305 [Arthrobacter sp. cf158]